jgi:glycyl-tRNA synthetase beta chain
VLAARLSDAAFFWENDLREAKSGMQDWAEGLKSVTFQSKLGSRPTASPASPRWRARSRPWSAPTRIRPRRRRSWPNSTCGRDGRRVPRTAGHDGPLLRAGGAGQPEAVADAARDHYSPLGPSDAVPTAPVSVAVALADKIDTLTGFWAIDEKPTGSKDPFALRRAALGVTQS